MQGQKAFSLATLINIIFIFGESLDREVMGLILVTSEKKKFGRRNSKSWLYYLTWKMALKIVMEKISSKC